MAGQQIPSGLYVAADGNYGDAAGMTIIDDSKWFEADYSILEEASDGRRADVADAIDSWIKDGRPDPENFDPEKDYLSEFLLQKYIGY